MLFCSQEDGEGGISRESVSQCNAKLARSTQGSQEGEEAGRDNLARNAIAVRSLSTTGVPSLVLSWTNYMTLRRRAAALAAASTTTIISDAVEVPTYCCTIPAPVLPRDMV